MEMLRDWGAWSEGVRATAGRPGHRKPEVMPPPLPLLQEAMKHLTLAELSHLIGTTIDGLGSTSTFRAQAAANMLLTVIQEHGAKLETVRGWGPLRAARMGQGSEGCSSRQHPGLWPLGQGHVPELEAEGDTDPTLPGSSE